MLTQNEFIPRCKNYNYKTLRRKPLYLVKLDWSTSKLKTFVMQMIHSIKWKDRIEKTGLISRIYKDLLNRIRENTNDSI